MANLIEFGTFGCFCRYFFYLRLRRLTVGIYVRFDGLIDLSIFVNAYVAAVYQVTHRAHSHHHHTIVIPSLSAQGRNATEMQVVFNHNIMCYIVWENGK
ncbi:MAG: hypothetical protein GY737_29605 [Desulfobacteraceae bacterium]|nr:hypothetical protein [Desulfobacteraceae bacterium]